MKEILNRTKRQNSEQALKQLWEEERNSTGRAHQMDHAKREQEKQIIVGLHSICLQKSSMLTSLVFHSHSILHLKIQLLTRLQRVSAFPCLFLVLIPKKHLPQGL